ncbi:MAG: glycosyl hydrolase family 28-related protein [bacterium]|nr:glycosyl hydrolase family 28-related protein [bacterium]
MKKPITLLLFTVFLLNVITIIMADTIIPASRRIDWTPGIPNGIPDSTGWAVRNVKDYGAKGDGVTDDYFAVMKAISNAQASNVIYFPAGTYTVSSQIIINYKNPKHHVLLKGAGPSGTIIRYTGTESSHKGIIYFQNTSGAEREIDLSSGFTKDSISLVSGSTVPFRINDHILIDQLNDPAVVKLNDPDTYYSRDNATRCIGEIARVTATNGAAITIDHPLHWNYNSGYTPQAWRTHDSSKSCYLLGIEDLKIENMNHPDINLIYFNHGLQFWARNVEGCRSGQTHVRLAYSYQCEIRGSYFHHSQQYTSGQGYGVRICYQTTDCLIEDNIFHYLRHSMVLIGGGTGNVFGYNYSSRMFNDNYPNTDWLTGDLLCHGPHPMMNLFEGNMGCLLLFDYVHGSASHITAFRNHIAGYSQGESCAVSKALRCVGIDQTNYNMNIVGNVLGLSDDTGIYETNYWASGDYRKTVWKIGYNSSVYNGYPVDTNCRTTAIRHGNYDSITRSTHWDPAISDLTLTNSYYLKSKPSFFGSLTWPCIGPDLNPMVSTIPAKQRYDQMSAGPPSSPAAPATNLTPGSSSNLKQVIVGPNPYKSNKTTFPSEIYKESITFQKLTKQAYIKIFSVSGKLVDEFEETDNDGRYIWKIPGPLASGVYLCEISNKQGERVRRKIMIIK